MMTMTSPSTLEVIIFLHCILLVTTSIGNENISCTPTYVAWMLIGYTAQSITKGRLALERSNRIRKFSRMGSSYYMVGHTGDLFEVTLDNGDSCALGLHANGLAEATGPLKKSEKRHPRYGTEQQQCTRRLDTWPTCIWTTFTVH